MSVDLNVFLSRSKMPDPSQWAQAIINAGFEARLDTDFDVDNFSGFLPCEYKSVEAGFEYYSDPVAIGEHTELGIDENYDFSVTFVTSSSIRELITSLICAGVLCQVSGGFYIDPQSGESYSSIEILDWIRAEVKECEKDL